MEGRCAAKLRRSEARFGHVRYCTQLPLPKHTRCRLHGGVTPRGIASPHFQSGVKSRALPPRMREDYEAHLIDPELLSLRREIAIHRAIAEDLKRRIPEGEASSAVTQQRWKALKAALASGEHERIRLAMAALDDAIAGGFAEWFLRAELRKEDELIQKFTRAENDRLEQLHQMMSREQVLAYMHGLSVSVKDAVEDHVADVATKHALLRRIAARFAELTDRRGLAGHLPGGVEPDGPEPLDSEAAD